MSVLLWIWKACIKILDFFHLLDDDLSRPRLSVSSVTYVANVLNIVGQTLGFIGINTASMIAGAIIHLGAMILDRKSSSTTTTTTTSTS